MPQLNLTNEEVDLLLQCMKNQRDGDLVRWKTLNSFLPTGTTFQKMDGQVNEHLNRQKITNDIIIKLKDSKQKTECLPLFKGFIGK